VQLYSRRYLTTSLCSGYCRYQPSPLRQCSKSSRNTNVEMYYALCETSKSFKLAKDPS